MKITVRIRVKIRVRIKVKIRVRIRVKIRVRIKVKIRVDVRAKVRVRVRAKVGMYSVHRTINSVHHLLGRILNSISDVEMEVLHSTLCHPRKSTQQRDL